MIDTQLRNGSLDQLAELLKAQQVAKMDAVVPATAIRSIDALLHVAGMGSKVEADTLEELQAGAKAGGGAGMFAPSPIMLGQLADIFGVPVKYLRRMHETRPDLFDANVNGWIHGLARTASHDGVSPLTESDGTPKMIHAPDARRFLFRSFIDADGGVGFGRSLQSNRAMLIDNLDPLIVFLQTLREVDPSAEVVTCNLSETRMTVRVASPTITAAAPALMKNYRPVTPGWEPAHQGRYTPPRPGGLHDFTPGAVHPTTGRRVGDIASAGMLFTNSETGNGRFVLAPEFTLWACTNGATRMADAVTRIHLGRAMDEGVISWSDETKRRNLELVSAMTRDAVQQFLSADYLQKVVAEVEAKAGAELTEPAAAVELVAKQLAFSDETARLVLDHFIRGGQPTAGGILNAVTSAAQVVASADVAHDLEAQAFEALDIAHRFATAS